jgi:hypothetical protein
MTLWNIFLQAGVHLLALSEENREMKSGVSSNLESCLSALRRRVHVRSRPVLHPVSSFHDDVELLLSQNIRRWTDRRSPAFRYPQFDP